MSVGRFLGRVAGHSSPSSPEHDETRHGDASRQAPPDVDREAASDTHALVPQRVTARALRTPHALAVWSEDGALSYEELELRSNQLAHHLRRLGVGAESVVGLHLPRSLEMVIGILGVWKAGGAYLPLDPEYPAERLRLFLSDARAGWLVTAGDALASGTLGEVEARLVDLERSAAEIGAESGAPLPWEGGGDSLAYVIYTSGSTGRPKGVMVSHGAVANHLGWRQAAYPLAPDDRFLQKASLSFDISVWEIFAPLIAGAGLVLARPGGQRDSCYLVELLARQRVSMAHFGVTLLRMVLEEPGLERCTSLKHVFVGGEVLPVALCERLLARVPVRLHHQYGPTEATVDAACWDCVPGETRAYVPLGGPVANTQLHVLDARGLPVAPGEVGELYIGGVGLARGYLHRPEATAAAFVPDPFSDVPGARLYRTGDRVRRAVDGTLEFIGRRDHQVKLRGYRIELEEIDAVLSRHAGIRQAVTVVRSGAAGEGRLVAYVVPVGSSEAAPGLASLRAYLEERLPDYMVPAVFVRLDALPLTPTGKIDRGALPEPEASHRFGEREPGEAPRGEKETLLARIWAEVLGLEGLGRDEHFLSLGGDSVLAVRLSARLRAEGLGCTPRHLFSHPTVAELAEALGPVEPLAREEATDDGAPEESHPLSPMQQGMLFETLRAPRSRVYHEQLCFELEGALEADAFEEAWRRVVAHHPTLRAVFEWEGLPAPRQRVAREASLELRWLDWRGHGASDQDVMLERLLDEDRERGFALAEGPPMRVTAIRRGHERTSVIWSVHHLVIDGWSALLALREVFAAYAALRSGVPCELPRHRPFRDFVRWVGSRELSAEASFWRESLGANVSPSAVEEGTERSVRCLRLSSEETARLEVFARRHRITLNTLLVGAWGVLLARRAGTADALFGVTLSGRSGALEGVQSMPGVLINTLPLRVETPPRAEPISWLQRLQERFLRLLEHEQTPLVEIQRWCGLPPGSALFDSLLVFENYPAEAERWRPDGTGLCVERRFGASHSPYPLTLTVRPGGALELWASYSPAKWSERDIERLLGHLERMLGALVSGEGARLSDVPWLTGAEVARLAERARGPRVDLPPVSCQPALFEAQVARTPEALAARFGDERLSYRELDARANRLARLLQLQGVGPERRVGIFLSRSMDLLVSVLAVLKAGGAYVPVDPDYPAERVAYVLEDADVAVLLTQAALRERVPASRARVLVLEEERSRLEALPATAPERVLGPESLAYVLYTSGSTGRPKGVMVEHGNLVNFLQSMRREPGLGPKDVVVALTSLSFDIAGLELFLPLMVGASVVMAPREWQLDGERLAAGVAECGATLLQATPTTWRMLLQAGLPEGVRPRALCGGEAMPQSLARALLQSAESVWNVYGPTETTIWSTVELLREGDGEGPISLGHPIDNTDIHVLDAQGRPVPVGVPGELFIGGLGVARGYLGRPELTAQRFVPDPFSEWPGARMYRTGDLVRRLEDGGVEFLGRVDLQVKVRGHRIELGEIEAVIGRHPGVEQAVVTAHARAAEDVRLVAYVVARRGHAPLDTEALRQWVAAGLPVYMVPSAFVSLPRFPLTPNGKVDRRALPSPDWSVLSGRSGGEGSAPRTPTEKALAELWRELLGVKSPRTGDGFFELGGHSLLAVQLGSRVRACFQVELSFQALIAEPTLAGMAAAIDAAAGQGEAVRGLVLESEAVLAPHFQPRSPAPWALPSEVLLTGATGFVGAFLLKALLERLPGRVHCLVRAAHPDEAMARLERHLRSYLLWDERLRERIVPLAGDLAKPGLGLAPGELEALGERLDAIYHCGAEVNFLYPYRALKAANVLGTEALLGLACVGRPKVFHHVSTLSVFPPRPDGVLSEEDPLERSTGFRTGYAQSKWVAEKLVAQARERGVPVAIYRLGTITGDSVTGAWNTSDFICRSLKSYIQLGVMPELDGTLDLIPADFVAKAMVHLSLRPGSPGKAFHFANPRAAPASVLPGLLGAVGHPLRRLPYARWFDELREDVRRSARNALYTLVPFLRELGEAQDGPGPIQPFARKARVDCRNTEEGLAGSGIECPPVDEALLRTYFRYFAQSGFLPPPGRHSG